MTQSSQRTEPPPIPERFSQLSLLSMGDPIYAPKESPESERTWKVSLAGRVAFSVLGFGALASSIGAGFAETAGDVALKFAALMAVLGGVFLAAAFRTSLTLTDEEIIVRNLGWTRSVPLSSVAQVQPGYNGIEIATSTGRHLTAMAVQKANASEWTGRHTRADDVVKAIQDAATRKAGGSPEDDRYWREQER